MTRSGASAISSIIFTIVLACAPVAGAAVTFSWATIGNPGNPADEGGFGPGAVPYTYQISKTEVTNNQYTEFLNAVDPTGANARSLYSANMTNFQNHTYWSGGINFNAAAASGSKYTVKSGQANLPVIWASWNSAARFANWLNNGQGSASTETGAYDMTQVTPTRLPGAKVFLPSEDEWYKAAYYDPTKNAGAGGYWLYATGSDTVPTSQPPPGGNRGANFIELPSGKYALTGSSNRLEGLIYLSDVGAYVTATSPYGTFDQNGNVQEWTEETGINDREVRGGHWGDTAFLLAANVTAGGFAGRESTGFRVAAIPEPGAVSLLAGLVGAALGRSRRRALTPTRETAASADPGL